MRLGMLANKVSYDAANSSQVVPPPRGYTHTTPTPTSRGSGSPGPSALRLYSHNKNPSHPPASGPPPPPDEPTLARAARRDPHGVDALSSVR
eukprot:scaffold98974_cov32-Tisochrysis_lutea.AAC.1